MTDRIRWITYKGQQVLRIDYSGLQGKEFLRVIEQVPPFYKGKSKASVLGLIDVSNSVASQEVMDALKGLMNTLGQCDKKVAVLGITGLKKALLVTANMFTGHSVKPFDNEQEALDWLVS